MFFIVFQAFCNDVLFHSIVLTPFCFLFIVYVSGTDLYFNGCLHVNDLLAGEPRAGSGVVRMDSLRFLAECRTRRLNQAQSVYHILACCIIVLWFIRAPFYVLLVFVAVCSVFWLFWLSCQYLPSDWLERLL